MKCSCRTMVLAAVAVVCFGAVAEAQQDRRPPGERSGQRGRPMMRGGFGGGGGLLGLVRIEAVQKEIELLDDQKAEIDKLVEELRGQRSEGDRPNFREMSEAEREKLFAEMRKKGEERTKVANAKLAKILLPHQTKRVKEIGVRLRGIGALNDPEIADKLKLTDAQKQKLKEIMQANMESMREKARKIFEDADGDREKMREEFRKLRDEASAKVLAVLTADQMKQFEELKGEPFEMPQGAFGRGGADRRPGEGRPGGRRPGEGRPSRERE